MTVRFFICALVLAWTPLAAYGQDFFARDWSMSCNDKLYCIARTKSDGMQLKIERSNTAESNLFVSVRIDAEYPLAEGMRVDLAVLDRNFRETKQIDRVYRGNEMTFSGAADRELIEALRLGNRGQVTVEFGGMIGTRVYDVSLAGVTSALAEIDRQQARSDRVDAIVLRGGTPIGSSTQTSLPEPVAPPVAVPSAEALWGMIAYEEDEIPALVLMPGYRVLGCQFPDVLGAFGANAYGVVGSLELWLVPCNQGDINIAHYVVLYDGDEAEFYEFTGYPDSGDQSATIINPQWDNASRTITSTYSNSFDGDCGAMAKYRYVTEDDMFDLIEFREKTQCDGVMTPPEDYPLVWRQ